jgi:membrane fusion protein, heavy metal efflux system
VTTRYRRLIGLVSFALATAACSRAQQASDPPQPSGVAGSIVLPPDSPILKQLRREPVAAVELATDEVTAPGKIEANPNRISKVAAPVGGRIASVLVRVGDAVRRNQPLFTIESPDADAAMAANLQTAAAVTQARAALEKAQTDVDRTRDLFEHDAIAKKELLNGQNAVTQAGAAVEQAEASRAQALRRLSVLGLSDDATTRHVVVRAPLAGKILELTVVTGEFRNDTNTPVMTIADLSTVWVSSQVPETYIRFIHSREKVEINLIAYPGETFEGRVSRIADTVDPQTRTVKVQADMENPDGRFRPEMFGNIHHIRSTARQPVVPANAVIEGNGRSILFVESTPGHFEERTVVEGKRSGGVIRIISGVQAGETVVVDGAMLLNGLLRKTA